MDLSKITSVSELRQIIAECEKRISEWKKVVIQFLVQRKRINNPLLDIVL